jgi:hypothetical protein
MRGIFMWEDRDDLFHFLMVLDSVWIDDFYKKQSAQREKAKAKAATPRTPG